MFRKSLKIIPVFENEFYHDGRGPELIKVIWEHEGSVLKGFEFFNPDDERFEENIKNVTLVKAEVFSCAGEEVHGNILCNGNSKAAIFRILNSTWIKQFIPIHLEDCSHYQIVFYDDIYDVICQDIRVGTGRINKQQIYT